MADELRTLLAAAVMGAQPPVIAEAVRTSLEWFARQHPGKAVELRVPPYRVVQILGGTTHRRGTPPAVVEMGPATWLDVLTGRAQWDDLVRSGAIRASGERSDLSSLLPAINL